MCSLYTPAFNSVYFYPDEDGKPADDGLELPQGALLLLLEAVRPVERFGSWANMEHYSMLLWDGRVGWVFTPNLRTLQA